MSTAVRSLMPSAVSPAAFGATTRPLMPTRWQCSSRSRRRSARASVHVLVLRFRQFERRL